MIQTDKLHEVNLKVEEVRTVMQSNLQKTLERGEKLDIMVEKSEQLEKDSKSFEDESAKVKRMMRCRSYRTIICVSVGISVGVGITALIMWGLTKNSTN